MEFNEIIEDKNKLKEKTSWLFDFYSGYEGERDYFRYVDHELIQPEKTYLECLSLKEPYRYDIKYKVEIYEGPNKGKQLESHIYIPKLCKNGFLILTASGELRWRSPINICLVRQVIRYFNSDDRLIIYLYNDDINQITIKIRNSNPSISYNNTEFTSPEYSLSSYFKSYGFDDHKLEKIGIPIELNNELPDWNEEIKFDLVTSKNKGKIINKVLQITKKDIANPNELTPQTLYDIIKVVFENNKALEAYSPMDCEFKSQFDMLMLELQTKRTNLYTNNSRYYQKWGEIPSNAINSAINSYFSMQSELYNSIQTTSDSNASSFLSQTNKIYFATQHNIDTPLYHSKSITHIPVKYTDDFVGIICPAKTPESVSGVNIKNELARSAVIKEGELFVKVLDKNMNQVELSLANYYKSRILATTNWDYDNKEIIPNSDGTITITHLGSHTRVPASGLNFDYLSLDSSSILSYTASMIPGANHSDSVRLSMACSEIDQAIPVLGSKPPVIYTGVESEVYKASDLNYKAEEEAEVEEVTEDYVKLLTKSGNKKIIQIPQPRETLNHTYSRYNVNFKPGDQIKAGDVIISSDSFKNKELALTTTLRSAFMHFKFKEEEDGFVLSESATKKLAHIIESEVSYYIQEGISYEFNYDEFIEFYNYTDAGYKKDPRINKYGLPIIGSKFHHGEIIAGINKQVTDEERTILFKLLKKKEFGVKPLRVPSDVDECIITNVVIKHRANLNLTENANECLNYYDKEYQNRYRSLTDNNIKVESNILPTNSDFIIEILITLRSINNVKLGDKLANRYGGKGTVIAIYPDEHMPRVGGPTGEIIECISSPLAPFNRKNPSQLIEHDLLAISNKIWKNHIKLIEEKNFNQIRSDLNDLFVTTRFNGYMDEDLIKLHNSYEGFYRIKVSAMDMKYKPEVLLKLLKKFDLEDGEYLYLPGKIDDHINSEYFMKSTKHKVQVGYSEYIRLHFLPEKKARATSDSDSQSDDLVLGNGKIRVGGQSQGNMEIWAYMSHGVLNEIDKVTSKSVLDDSANMVKLQMAMLGLQVSIRKLEGSEDDAE